MNAARPNTDAAPTNVSQLVTSLASSASTIEGDSVPENLTGQGKRQPSVGVTQLVKDPYSQVRFVAQEPISNRFHSVVVVSTVNGSTINDESFEREDLLTGSGTLPKLDN